MSYKKIRRVLSSLPQSPPLPIVLHQTHFIHLHDLPGLMEMPLRDFCHYSLFSFLISRSLRNNYLTTFSYLSLECRIEDAEHYMFYIPLINYYIRSFFSHLWALNFSGLPSFSWCLELQCLAWKPSPFNCCWKKSQQIQEEKKFFLLSYSYRRADFMLRHWNSPWKCLL